MTSQLLIIIIILALLLLMGGVLMLLAVGVLFFIRSGGNSSDQLPSSVDTARVEHRLRTGTTIPPPPARQPPAASLPGLEPMGPGPEQYLSLDDDTEDTDGMKTEVFQRGTLPADWEDEDGEATEVFRANIHGELGLDDYKID